MKLQHRKNAPGEAEPKSGPSPDDCAAVVLGLDSHGLAVARALARSGVAVYALERDAALPGTRSNCVRQIFPVSEWQAAPLFEALSDLRHALAAHARVSLLAISDRQVAALGANLQRLRHLYAMAWADAADHVLRLQRKAALVRHCEAYGLDHPRTQIVASLAELSSAHGLRYPVIAKPVTPLSGFKTVLAADDQALRAQLAPHAASFPIVLQEYVPGDDRQIFFGALMLNRGDVVGSAVGRKLASYPPARGQTTAAETVDLPEVERLTRRFFAGLSLSGPVSLELKRDPNGRFWVIEPTVGRTDFWAGLCIEAGFNQPLLEHQLACGLPLSPQPSARRALWFDSERDPLALFKYGWRAQKWLSATPTFSYADRHDPAPLWAALRQSLRRVTQR